MSHKALHAEDRSALKPKVEEMNKLLRAGRNEWNLYLLLLQRGKEEHPALSYLGAFWSMVLHSLQQSALLALTKLCDGTKNAISMNRLVVTVTDVQRDFLTHDQCKVIKSKWKSSEDLIKRIKNLRNQKTAHLSEEYVKYLLTGEKDHDKQDFSHPTRQEIGEAFDLLESLLNEITGELFDCTEHYEIIGFNSVEYVLEKLAEGTTRG